MTAESWEIVLRGGRVIDPESGLDGVRDVAIAGGRVAEVGPSGSGRAPVELDVTGLVVTAGFVDVHSHVNDVAGQWLQALDGVTTALELEAGAAPVASAYRAAAAEGRPINYGFATSWAQARMAAVAGITPDGTLAGLMAHIADPAWMRAAGPRQVDAMLARLSADLADGALGIGVLLGYAPGSAPREYLRVAGLAASAGVPVFTHARDLVELVPGTPADGAEEIVRAAGQTGAAMHYCHVNSTSQRHIDRVLSLVARAQAAGARVSTEAYPYGSGMTGIGAAFLAPERLGERGLVPSSLTYAATGERVADVARLRELREADPGGLVIIDLLDENDPADLSLLMRSLTFPGGIVASDAMPLTWAGQRPPVPSWPLAGRAMTHPRTAGTFGRALRLLTRDGGGLGLAEALARCSLEPARLLEDRAPAMRGKGRLRAGSDADIVVFDPEAISDRASYRDSTRPSAGIRHVLVGGTFVVRDEDIVTDARPGRPVRALRAAVSGARFYGRAGLGTVRGRAAAIRTQLGVAVKSSQVDRICVLIVGAGRTPEPTPMRQRVIATDERFETFTDSDDEWFSDIELRALDLEKELSEWRESRARAAAEEQFLRERERELAEPGVRRDASRHTAAFHHTESRTAPRPPRQREFLRASGGAGRRHESRSAPPPRSNPTVGHAWPITDEELTSANERTQVLIDRGRRTARQRRRWGTKKIAITGTLALVLVIVFAMTVFRQGASWPASVATVQAEITTACQNPNVVSEPSQVNFACARDTSQILWVFALMTSNDNPDYADAKTGRKGLEPIAPNQGGEIAWSLNLHHPYNPVNPIDSLEVAARAINNIIGGATLTASNGNPTVQPGLLSNPANCARYTGSSAIVSHAGFPSQCATPVTSAAGQAALVADVYQQWMVGATSVAAQDVSVLFENSNNPGDPQVQAILKTLPSGS